MNRQEFEQFLLYELLDGHPEDVLCHMNSADILEEFTEMLYVWSKHQQNPNDLKDALQRFVIGMIDRITKAQNLPEYDDTEDKYFDREDRLYQERRDRELESFKGKEA